MARAGLHWRSLLRELCQRRIRRAQRAGASTRDQSGEALPPVALGLEGRRFFIGLLLKNGEHPAQRKEEQITRDKECRRRDETSAHKPRDAEGGPGEQKQARTGPAMQRPARGVKQVRAEGGPREPRQVLTALPPRA
ncbi:unnamed protein product [Rangifer tarandus platyrhynchus]|uniref:Uncharacterized protein n=1 Tax=Rangifer tarandus platyrhynchus TaxID=3082113 RepID=A0AC59YPL0_RANTA